MSSTSEQPRGAVAGAIGQYRWVICALLFFATTINYIDRQIFSLLKETLDKEMGWSNEQFGLVNSFFQGAYAVGLLAFGWIVDRFGPKIGYALSIAGWSLAACGHGLVHSIFGFKIARISLGLSEAGNFPSAIKTVAQWFPKRERALATALFNAGANAGPIIAPLTIPFIAAQWGWRSAFVAAGLLGFLWLIAWWAIYENPEKSRRVNAAELAFIRSDVEAPASAAKTPWLHLLRYRQTWSFIVGKALTDPIWWFFLIWLPDYFNKTRGLNIQKSKIHLATIYAICTVLSVAGGWLTGHLQRLGWSVTRARKTGMLLFAFCVLPIMGVTSVGNWTAVLLIGLAAAAHQAWSANLYTTVSDMFPKAAVASVVGIGGMAGSVTGIFFPTLTGKLLDNLPAQQGYTILFGICGSAYLVAFIIHHLLAPRFDPVRP
ncbi:MAG TPA: MFS transporter [Verrucomicrobiae bacterium]|jgi:ACS family hexuronate transporter-like MFS transporter|nr:MFS transporter [Verrucomicrobiae bacterium]